MSKGVWYSDLMDHVAEEHASRVAEEIRSEIKQNGPMSFSRFMEIALYAPGLGYYCVGTEKIGVKGDFVTAPEISPLFAECLAGYCEKVLSRHQSPAILEIGAGTGRLALGILKSLEKRGCLPERYYILDISPELKQRQREFIEQEAPEILSRIVWLNESPQERFDGIIIANEVLDAMPVTLFQRTESGYQERVVTSEGDYFSWGLRSASAILEGQIKLLDIDFPLQYSSEINVNVAPWLKSIENFISAGEIILIDYGFLQREYYHPQRCAGTLMCHYQQRAHTDPLILTGIQDITAHVDFTAVGNAAESLGLRVCHYSTQAEFLLQNGLLDIMRQVATTPEMQFKFANQVKMLTLPSEMGELFKVMVLKKA